MKKSVGKLDDTSTEELIAGFESLLF